MYPFRQSTLQKLDEDIGEIRANLSSALHVLQLKDNKRIQDDITEIKFLFWTWLEPDKFRRIFVTG